MTIVLFLLLGVSIVISVSIAFGAKAYNAEAKANLYLYEKVKIPSFEGRIKRRDGLYFELKMQSIGKGNIDKIKAIEKEYDWLIENEKAKIEPVINDPSNDVKVRL